MLSANRIAPCRWRWMIFHVIPIGCCRMLQQMAEVIAQQNASITALRIERDATARSEQEAAQAEIEKLRLLIRQLQRGQFGRRSEQLDPDQLQLGLEDLEQTVAAAEAAQEEVAARSSTPRTPRVRRRNLGALPAHLPRIEVLVDVEDKSCPCCGGDSARDRRGHERDARHRARPAAGEGDPPPALRLPDLRGGGGAGARTGAADHRRDGDRGAAGARAGGQVRRFPAALPPGRDLRPARDRARPLHALRLGRSGLLVAGAAVAPAAPARHELDPDLRRRHARCRCSTPAGAGPRPGGCGATRSTTGPGTAAPRRRWSTSTPRTARASTRPPTWPSSRACCRWTATAASRACWRTARRTQIRLAFCWAHCRRRFYEIHQATGSPLAEEALRRIGELYADRGRDPRPPRRGATRGPAGAQQADRGRPARLAHGPAGAGLGQVHPGRGDPLRPAPLAGAGAVPRGRPARAGHEHHRAGDPADRPGAQEQPCSPARMAGPATGRSWRAWWRPRS